MIVLLLVWMLHPTLQTTTTYNLGTAFVILNSISESPIFGKQERDMCQKVILRDKQVYHLSQNGVYQSWSIENLSSCSAYLSTFGQGKHRLNVDSTGKLVAVLQEGS